VTTRNRWHQPVGDPVRWRALDPLAAVHLTGRWVRLEPLGREHAGDLYAATCGADEEPSWTYLRDEMPASRVDFARYVETRAADPGLASVAILASGPVAVGLASWMRDDPGNGVVEVGSILLGPGLRRTTAATEAMWLMARHAFENGYRRYEWKCDALNAASRSAAARLGFTYEGTFRQAVVTKGRNRDTAWFAITDGEWPHLRAAFQDWLDPANFDEQGRQRARLQALPRA
jgi:RimJ/RimL family protein N-acetyltransferase